jgi:hypothetical protein
MPAARIGEKETGKKIAATYAESIPRLDTESCCRPGPGMIKQ